MKTSAVRLREAARAAMIRGWAVFPVVGKRPATRHGVHDASTDLEMVSEWWPDGTSRGLALATGQPSGVWVLDLDGTGALCDFLELQDGNEVVQGTVSSQTGGGWHRFFAMPTLGDVRNSASKLRPGVDVRGTGGYVVLPPSPHPSGACYQWLPGLAPWEAPVAQAPPWLLALVSSVSPPAPLGRVHTAGYWGLPTSSVDPRYYVVAAIRSELVDVASASEGTRNSTLNRAAYSLARFVGTGDADVHDLARELAQAASWAGLGEDEIRRTVYSAFKARGVVA